jgi:hypothetical protein
MTVEKAEVMKKGTRHHHLIIDEKPIAKGKIVPKNATHLHFGDGSHISLGPDYANTINIIVKYFFYRWTRNTSFPIRNKLWTCITWIRRKLCLRVFFFKSHFVKKNNKQQFFVLYSNLPLLQQVHEVQIS